MTPNSGFCIRNFPKLFLLGYTLKASSNMRKSFPTATRKATLLPFDQNAHNYRSLQEKNIVSVDGMEPSTNTITLILVLASVGIFLLTVMVMCLLFYRNSRDNVHSGDVPNDQEDARLGINVVNYLGGSNWLELKSTSSGSSPSEPSSDDDGRLPKEVGRSGISVCDSSVSELSAYALEAKDRRLFTTNLDLEKIDEEGQCIANPSTYKTDASLHTTVQCVCNLDNKIEDMCSDKVDRYSF